MPLTAAGQTRLREDLRGLIKGDVRCGEVTQQLYATDASILQARPICIVYPRNTDDIIAVAQYAAEAEIPLHLRGAGTSLTGESLGEGIILVFSRYMRRLLRTGDDFVRIQPGMLRRRLNSIIGQSQKRLFGPLACNVSSASLGSILARNGAGIHYLRYGLPSEHLLSLTVVLANGDVLTLDRNALIQPLQGDGSVALAQEIAYGKEYIYAGKVAQILENRTSNQLLESANQLAVNRAGYAEHSILRDSHVDLTQLFTGSEGTLGIIVDATLKTVSLPNRKGAAAFFFRSIFSALEAVSAVLPLRPALCELVDRRRLTMIRDWDSRYRPLIPQDAEAALLVELNSGTLEEPLDAGDCQNNLKHLIDLIQTKRQLSFHAIRVHTERDFQLFDQIIRRSELILGRMHQTIQPIPLFDDIAVPVDAIHHVVGDLFSLLQKHNLTASISGHIGQGHLRVHPLLDTSQPDMFPTFASLAEEVYATIWQHGGTISSEWGTGLLKSQFVPQQFPQLMSLFRNMKETFDPLYLLNPGSVIPLGKSWTQSLRHGLEKRGQPPPVVRPVVNPAVSPAVSRPVVSRLALRGAENSVEQDSTANIQSISPNQVEIQLKWDPSYVFEPAYRCNGCGECFRFDPQSRICPFFRGTAMIENAPRAKADLLRGILEQDIGLEALTWDRAKEVADACFHCRMCDIECPSNVDINVLAFRSKAAYVAAHGLPLQDSILSRLDKVLEFLAHGNFIFNTAMRNRTVRWLLEKTIKIPQSRVIPMLASQPYLHRVRWSSLLHRASPEKTESDQTTKPKVALFLDTHANYFDPQLAELAVQILEHNGIAVHVPARQKTSGKVSFSVGHASRAERLARYNASHLSDLIRQGYKIVTIEPYSASCLTKDYRDLIEREELDLLSENVVDFCSFLLQYHRSGKLRRDFQPLLYRIGYHAPCSGLSLSASLATDVMPAERILRLIPGLGLERLERGCCGMGGLWGFKQQNYRHSLQIGFPLFRSLRSLEIDFGVSECMSCCVQMLHGSRKPAVHPIRVLAVAYDFIPPGMLLR